MKKSPWLTFFELGRSFHPQKECPKDTLFLCCIYKGENQYEFSKRNDIRKFKEQFFSSI